MKKIVILRIELWIFIDQRINLRTFDLIHLIQYSKHIKSNLIF